MFILFSSICQGFQIPRTVINMYLKVYVYTKCTNKWKKKVDTKLNNLECLVIFTEALTT